MSMRFVSTSITLGVPARNRQIEAIRAAAVDAMTEGQTWLDVGSGVGTHVRRIVQQSGACVGCSLEARITPLQRCRAPTAEIDLCKLDARHGCHRNGREARRGVNVIDAPPSNQTQVQRLYGKHFTFLALMRRCTQCYSLLGCSLGQQ
jgi:hypothetical protein